MSYEIRRQTQEKMDKETDEGGDKYNELQT